MKGSSLDAFLKTLLALVASFIVGIVHEPVYGYLTFISLQLTAILGHVCQTNKD